MDLYDQQHKMTESEIRANFYVIVYSLKFKKILQGKVKFWRHFNLLLQKNALFWPTFDVIWLKIIILCIILFAETVLFLFSLNLSMNNSFCTKFCILLNKYLVFLINKFDYTGLRKRDETSETTVRNLYCLFPFIHDSPQL